MAEARGFSLQPRLLPTAEVLGRVHEHFYSRRAPPRGMSLRSRSTWRALFSQGHAEHTRTDKGLEQSRYSQFFNRLISPYPEVRGFTAILGKALLAEVVLLAGGAPRQSEECIGFYRASGRVPHFATKLGSWGGWSRRRRQMNRRAAPCFRGVFLAGLRSCASPTVIIFF